MDERVQEALHLGGEEEAALPELGRGGPRVGGVERGEMEAVCVIFGVVSFRVTS